MTPRSRRTSRSPRTRALGFLLGVRLQPLPPPSHASAVGRLTARVLALGNLVLHGLVDCLLATSRQAACSRRVVDALAHHAGRLLDHRAAEVLPVVADCARRSAPRWRGIRWKYGASFHCFDAVRRSMACVLHARREPLD